LKNSGALNICSKVEADLVAGAMQALRLVGRFLLFMLALLWLFLRSSSFNLLLRVLVIIPSICLRLYTAIFSPSIMLFGEIN
jgi:hypothetical protein